MKDSKNASEKVTNLTYLTDLSKGNKEFVTEMIEIFCAENPHELDSLERSVQDSDYEQIQSISHHMRSTMPIVGLDVHIGKELIELEQLAKTSSGIQTIRFNFGKIKAICQKALEELKC